MFVTNIVITKTNKGAIRTTTTTIITTIAVIVIIIPNSSKYKNRLKNICLLFCIKVKYL